MKIFKNRNKFRVAIQWAIILLLGFMLGRWAFDKVYVPNFEAYCPFGGLQALSSYLVSGTLACSMTTVQIFMGLTLLVGVVLFSKLFCGYICPLGTFSEWLGTLGKKVFGKRRDITGIADKALRSIKYILLFLTFYFTLGSSELFCKNYDPFYATFSLFNSDVTVWMAIVAIALLILGAMAFRMFWCKYLCPLGAISNIFRFFIMFAAVLGLYIILIICGIKLSYVWPIAIISILGYALEIWKMESRIFPFIKVTRDVNACTNCGKCAMACRHHIPVDKLETVTHIDCDLCGECLHSCSKEHALSINKRKGIAWLPAAIVIALVIIGIVMGAKWRVATIDVKWGSKDAIENAKVYERSGIKSVKCYGSSMNFANHIRPVKGILGVATYVGDHTVRILYDPKILSPEKITEIIFSASVESFIDTPEGTTKVQMVEFGIEHFFDQFDATYLKNLLLQFGNAYGFETHYGEPVVVRVYFPVDYKVDLEKLKEKVESKSVTYKIMNNVITKPVNFETVNFKAGGEITIDEYKKIMYVNYYRAFNHQDRYSDSITSIVEYKTELIDKMYPHLLYLQNHVQLSDTGVVAIQSYYKEQYPVIRFFYVRNITNPQKIDKMVRANSLTVKFKTGAVKSFANPFKFVGEGTIVERE